MLIDDINKEIIKAKKIKNKKRSDTLVLIKSELINNEKNKNPKKEIDVINSYVKKLEKSLEIYKNTSFLYEQIEKEIQIAKEFLPTQISSDSIKKGVELFLKQNPDINDMSTAMKALRVIYPMNGKEVSMFVRDFLDKIKKD